MTRPPIPVHRHPERLHCNARRTITRFFWPGGEARARSVFERVMALGDADASDLLQATLRQFGERHPDIHDVVTEHYDEAKNRVGLTTDPDPDKRLLIGAYFTMEYAFESAALFNPSMVPAPRQDGIPPGSSRFIMSLRAVGEGHLSSIVFRGGVIDEAGEITFDPMPAHTRRLRIVEDRLYDKNTYRLKLIEMGAYADPAGLLLGAMGDRFTRDELAAAIERARTTTAPEGEAQLNETAENMMWLARSNYHIEVPPDADLSAIVMFPHSENESQGMEDMRLVRFVNDDGSARYLGTYTAFSGTRILPQIMEYSTPGTAVVHTLNGRFARNKGLAFFPRRIDGWYVMIARVDGESMYLCRSDNIRFWNEGSLIQAPRYPWEFIQIGNCGSPIETDAGWLLLTHGVGPMRRYCIGASLLDRADPSRVIGQLAEPLMIPLADEQSGYVPNVVYSCGAMIHGDLLVIPYGISDAATGFATVPLRDLLARLTA